MRTFQDLEKISDIDKGKFCKSAVEEFRSSEMYKVASEGEAYYNKHNKTIEQYQKMITTLSGVQVVDYLSANHKLKTLFFRRLVTQQVQYVLGNGVVLENTANKDKLGKDFDFQVMNCAKRAMAGGAAFGFWNVNHVEVFGFADTHATAGFCPLYDDKTGKLRAGIRFWFRKIDNDVICRMTLYEEDGYTEYSANGNDVEIVEPKRGYVRVKVATADGVIEDIYDENYTSLPIVPMYANDCHESELVGIRECIDCYDLIKSGLANNIDDASEIYWIIKNAGGMDDVDYAEFLQRVKRTKVAGGEDVDIEAQTMDIPTEARTKMLEILRKDIYEDFQALDVQTLSAAAKTTQEIQASYQGQDNKCADFEYFIIDFIQQILALAGIDDNPTFVWNRVVNQSEQTQMVLSAQNFLPQELIIKHLPFLTPEEADEAIKALDMDDSSQFDDEGDNSYLEDINSMLDSLLEDLENE